MDDRAHNSKPSSVIESISLITTFHIHSLWWLSRVIQQRLPGHSSGKIATFTTFTFDFRENFLLYALTSSSAFISFLHQFFESIAHACIGLFTSWHTFSALRKSFFYSRLYSVSFTMRFNKQNNSQHQTRKRCGHAKLWLRTDRGKCSTDRRWCERSEKRWMWE